MQILPSHRSFGNVIRTKRKAKRNTLLKENSSLFVVAPMVTCPRIAAVPPSTKSTTTSTFNVFANLMSPVSVLCENSGNIKPDGWLMGVQERIIMESLTFEPQVESQCSYLNLNKNVVKRPNSFSLILTFAFTTYIFSFTEIVGEKD